jgi:hypothetical protein
MAAGLHRVNRTLGDESVESAACQGYRGKKANPTDSVLTNREGRTELSEEDRRRLWPEVGEGGGSQS